uniref:Uncharacterized protein n=1 Tax=Mesocestoides corti TaxID=53468 RepID=A0A5K3EQB3_MESCO
MRRTLESVAAERLHQLGRDPLQVIHRKNLQEDLEIVKEIVTLAEKSINGNGSTSLRLSHSTDENSDFDDGSPCSEKSRNQNQRNNPSPWSRTFKSNVYQHKLRNRTSHPTNATSHSDTRFNFICSPKYRYATKHIVHQRPSLRRHSSGTALKLTFRRTTQFGGGNALRKRSSIATRGSLSRNRKDQIDL